MVDFLKLEQLISENANKNQLEAYKNLLMGIQFDDIIRRKENQKELIENRETNLDLKLSYEGCSLLILVLLNNLNINIHNAKIQLTVNSFSVFLMTLLLQDMVKSIFKSLKYKPSQKAQIIEEIESLKKQKEQKEKLLKLTVEKIGQIEKREIVDSIYAFLDKYGEPNLNWSVTDLLKSYGVIDDCLNPEFNHFIYLLNKLSYIKGKEEFREEQEKILAEFRLIRKNNRRKNNEY